MLYIKNNIFNFIYMIMKYIKTFEFVSTTRISIKELIDDCIKYNIDLSEIISEMISNKIITFHCDYQYIDDITIPVNKSVTGRCEGIKIHNEYNRIDEWNILIKMNNKWYELTSKKVNNTQQLIIYNFEKDSLYKKLELDKNTKKYNI